MRPIPDVPPIGGPNLFVYPTQEEYTMQIHYLMKYQAAFSINIEKYSWKEKSRQFEEIFKGSHEGFIQIY
jgi:hypothetical protein